MNKKVVTIVVVLIVTLIASIGYTTYTNTINYSKLLNNTLSFLNISTQEEITMPISTGIQTKDLNTLKNLFNQKKYLEIINSPINNKNSDSKYILALSFYNYYISVKNKDKNSDKYILHSIQIFKEINNNTKNRNLKAKSAIWYAMLSYKYTYTHTDFNDINEALLYIKKYEKKSIYYNDALFYLALIYQRNKNYYEAKNYFFYLSNTPLEDPVYDIFQNKQITPPKALALYQPIKKKQRPVQLGSFTENLKEIHKEIINERYNYQDDIFIDKDNNQ